MLALDRQWIDGVRLTDAAGLRSYGLRSAPLLATLVQCSLRQMLSGGFFHADPHAGNLLVTRRGQLAFVDFGMMATVTPPQRDAMIEAMLHLVTRDYDALARLYRTLGFIQPEQDVRPIADALRGALPDVISAPVSQLNLKRVLEAMGHVMYENPFSLPPYYAAVLRCLAVLEGVALQVHLSPLHLPLHVISPCMPSPPACHLRPASLPASLPLH